MFLNENESVESDLDLSKSNVYYFLVRKNTTSAQQLDKINITMSLVVEKQTEELSNDLTEAQIEAINEREIKIEISPINALESPDDEVLSVTEIVDLLPEIKKYDDGEIFNYFYQPVEDKKILKPLKSASFNNHNHFYNQYTICKIKTYDSMNDSNIFINT